MKELTMYKKLLRAEYSYGVIFVKGGELDPVVKWCRNKELEGNVTHMQSYVSEDK